MSFISAQFLFFAVALILIYFVAPKAAQPYILLIGSLLFYISNGVRFVPFLILTTITVYFAAISVESIETAAKAKTAADASSKKQIRENAQRDKRIVCATALFIDLGIWIVLKCAGFFVSNVNRLLSLMNIISESFPIASFIVPLGMSYYIFMAASYLIDIYRGKYKAERNILKLLLFLCYFPHIVQGPFSRFDKLGKTLFEKHGFSYQRLCEGASRILWGLFKKLIIADKLAVAVAEVFGQENGYKGIAVFIGTILYSVQIYTDFTGYMDIAGGLSHILGIELSENFRRPYFSKSIDEFWRRWHITLGAWFKDYLFYPISMSKAVQRKSRELKGRLGAKAAKLIPGYVALVAVWTATGLWHGTSWGYLVWGWLNMAVIMLGLALTDTYKKLKAVFHIRDGRAWGIFSILRTFVLVCIIRIFSRADSLYLACLMIRDLFQRSSLKLTESLGMMFSALSAVEICAALIGTIAVIVVDLLCEAGCWEAAKKKTPFLVRNILYVAMFFSLVLLAGGDSTLVGNFLYAQF